MKHSIFAVALNVFLCIPVCSQARAGAEIAPPKPDASGGALTIYFENDIFGGTDHYYTNGIKFSLSSPDVARFSDTAFASPLLPLLNRIPFVNRSDFQKNVTFSIGQNIYTPDNTESAAPLPNDRPYAGWLYGGFGIVLKNADVQHSFNLEIGVVGSYSLAQETQRFVHGRDEQFEPKGWENQLHNEVGVVAAYEYAWRWPKHESLEGFGWDFIPHAGLAVGNVYDYVNLGAEARLGFNLPDDFGNPGISPTSTTPTPANGYRRTEQGKKFDLGAYIFGRVDGRLVARNIFLDGNTFGNSLSVNKRWAVADISGGAAVNYHNAKLTYAFTYRTEEFKGQGGGQLFGSVTVTFVF